MTTKLTIADVLNQIDEELYLSAGDNRPDYCTNVELEKLTAWRDAIVNHTGKVCPWCKGSRDRQCDAKHGSLYCSRIMEHDGPHVACSAAPDEFPATDHNIARWEQEPATKLNEAQAALPLFLKPRNHDTPEWHAMMKARREAKR